MHRRGGRCQRADRGPRLRRLHHRWICLDTLENLPDGDLRDLLTRDDLRLMIENGSYFPDGGYAIQDGYGEIAHWEPFQTTYLAWIRDTYEPPWTDEAAEHIAFLMGAICHGMGDQLFDGMYLERHAEHDAGSPGHPMGVDASTDLCMGAQHGPVDTPEVWVPAEVLAPLFGQLGHEVDPDTITSGQNLVSSVIYWSSTASQIPATLEEHQAAYPWACANLDDPTIPGSPPNMAAAMGAYWQVLWDRLHGHEVFDEPLLGSWPAAGSLGHPTGADTVESMVSFAVSRGLNPDTLTASSVTVTDDADESHAVDLHVYYGHNSHVVNLTPQADWPADRDLTVTVSPDYSTFDGLARQGAASFGFTTRSEDEACCQCRATGASPAAAGWLVLLLFAAIRSRAR